MKVYTKFLISKKYRQKTVLETSTFQHNLNVAFYYIALSMICISSPAYADWFQVQNIKANLITPVYGLVNDNLGFIAFAVGGVATFLARGQDMWQKAAAFGVGSLGTAGSVKLAQTVLHLG
jgi:hypothetical protein